MVSRSGFRDFKWNKRGYRSVQNSAAVQSILARYADSAAGGATARTNAHGHDGSHFEKKQVQGKFAKGYVVHPTTYEGAAHSAEALKPYAD